MRGFAPGFTMPDSPIQTAFALLFLLRASESYRPITPRPVGPAPVVTPGDTPVTPPPPEGPPPVLPLTAARAVLDRFAEHLVATRIRSPQIALDALRFIRRTYASYRPDGTAMSPAHDAWCRRAEDLCLEATEIFRDGRRTESAIRQAISLEALRTLRSLDARVAPRLMRLVDTLSPDRHLSRPVQVAWYGTAFETLRRLEAPGLAAWIRARMLSATPAKLPRTSAAVTALAGLPHTSAEARHATAKALVHDRADLRKTSADDLLVHGLMIDVTLLFTSLVPGVKGALPDLPGRDVKGEYGSLASFFRKHDRPSASVWR